jgi:hypothetical protein
MRNDNNHLKEVCWESTKKFRRKIPKPQVRYLKKYWNHLFKGNVFGYGFVIIPSTKMVYFYSEKIKDNKLYRKFWYASTINEIISGNFAELFF